MIPRWPVYAVLGWLMIAAVASFGHTAHLTLVLPMVSVIFLTHAVLSFPTITVQHHVILALVLGYLDDLHHQAIVGSSTLGHVAACGVALWAALRFSTHSMMMRMMLCGAMTVVVNLMIATVALLAANRVGVQRDTVLDAWPQVIWQMVATMLLVVPIWLVLDRLLKIIRLAPVAKVRESQTEVVRL